MQKKNAADDDEEEARQEAAAKAEAKQEDTMEEEITGVDTRIALGLHSGSVRYLWVSGVCVGPRWAGRMVLP